MDINTADLDAEFEASFAAAMGVEPEAPVDTAPEVADDAPAEEPAAPEETPVEEPDPEVPAEPAPADPAPAPQPYIDPKYLAQALAEAEALRQQQAAPAPTEPEAPKAPSYEDYLTPEQKAQLATFSGEWSDVAAPVQTLINAHVQAALAAQQQQILAQVQQQMAPIQQATAQSQEAVYWNTISAAHPDFREVAAKLPEWIENQPYKAAQQFLAQYQSGNPADAVALLNAYKQAMGSTGAAPALPASSAVQATPKAAPVSKAALAATAAMPSAQRSKATVARDPNDAEGSFDEAFGAR